MADKISVTLRPKHPSSRALFLLGSLFLLLPLITLAAGLVPCDGYNTVCQACHLIQLGNNILKWLVIVMASIGALVIMMAGLKMVTAGGNAGKISAAKKTIGNIILGYILLLAAWLIIDTIMKQFVDGAKVGVWNQIECVAQPPLVPNPIIAGGGTGGGPGGTGNPGGSTGGGGTTPPPSTPAGPGSLSDTDARKRLADAGITVNKTQAQGTSLEGMKEKTVQNIIDLKNGCNCSVIVTGGTESTGGHAGGATSHGSGNKYDVRLDPQLDAYITKNYKDIGRRSDGAQMYKNSDTGVIYAREGNHWDVLVP